ncbi:MAG TPA: hypothetical protein VMV27_16720 [Candidatus Binataceae bacterium]|nr:hypothetical protein [Candidatus Binataceae bacterium]
MLDYPERGECAAFDGRSPMSSMAKMAVFVVLGSALTVGALMIASYLSTAAG